MAGRRTLKRQPFEGRTWADETGQTFEVEHNGVKGRIRFNDDGRIYLFA
jgi:hypothetical protein